MTRREGFRGRQALIAVALSAMLVTAGCTGVLGGDGDGSGSGSAQLDSVPADASMIGYVDAAGMVSDDSLRELANAALEAQSQNSEFYQGPTSVDEVLQQLEDQSTLDPTNVETMTFFATEGQNVPTNAEQAGAILTTSFSEDEIVSVMEEQGTQFSEETYQDTTLYTYGFDNQNALAALGDGTFAIGNSEAVRSVLDVNAGDESAVSGDLRAHLESTNDGYLQFAADVPQNQLPTDQIGQGSPVNTSAFNTVDYVSGSLSTSGDSVTTQVNLVSASSADAARIGDVIDGALAVYSGIGNEEIRDTLEAVQVDQSGDTVSVSFTETVDTLADRIELLYSMNAGASASTSGSDASTGQSASMGVQPVSVASGVVA